MVCYIWVARQTSLNGLAIFREGMLDASRMGIIDYLEEKKDFVLRKPLRGSHECLYVCKLHLPPHSFCTLHAGFGRHTEGHNNGYILGLRSIFSSFLFPHLGIFD